MRIIPAISIMSGRIVIVEDGQYIFLRNEENQYRNPTNVIQELGSDIIFILDIDGIETNRPDLNLITKLSAYKELWVDAAPLTSGSVADILISGASKAVIGTKSMLSLDHLAEAVELSENIIFSLDYDNGIVAADKEIGGMPVDELLSEVKAKGVRRVILFDLGGIRDKRSPDIYLLGKIAERFAETYLIGYVQPGDEARLQDTVLDGIIVDFRKMGAAHEGS